MNRWQVAWDIVIDQPHIGIDDDNRESLERALPVFRSIGALLVIPWFWSADVHIWRTMRVNYLYLLESDVRVTESPREVTTGTMYLCSLILVTIYGSRYYKHDVLQVCKRSIGMVDISWISFLSLIRVK